MSRLSTAALPRKLGNGEDSRDEAFLRFKSNDGMRFCMLTFGFVIYVICYSS